MGKWPFILALSSLSGCVTGLPETGMAGHYSLAEGPDVAGELILTPDHRFSYALAAGALDERSQGRWEQDGPAACLFTDPRPVAPVFSRNVIAGKENEPRSLLVTWPGGEGIAGIDFRIGFRDGSVIDGYTQHDGWSMPSDDPRQAGGIELAVPMHSLQSPRFPLEEPDSGPWLFVLTPNDLGTVDFQHACITREGNGFALERDGGKMRFLRMQP